MSNNNQALQTTGPGQGPPPVLVEAKGEITYVPFGSDDKVKLSLKIIRDYVAVPYTGQQDGRQVTLLPDDRESMRFMMLCRSRRLNPFEGDCFMIPFWDSKQSKPAWALVTGIEAFRKRAEMHPEYDGISSGVIVQDSDDEIKELEGDFVPPNHTLLGGWARVTFKTRKVPTVRKLNLRNFQKKFGQWLTDPEGMIVTRAESHALRDSFPTLLGGMQLREEVIEVEVKSEQVPARRPEFAKGLPAPDMPSPTAQAATRPRAALPAPQPVNTPAHAAQAPQQPAAAQPQAPQPAAQSEPTPEPEPPPITGQEAGESEPEPGAPEAPPTPGDESESTAEPPIDLALEPTAQDTAQTTGVKRLAKEHGVTWNQLAAWLRKLKLMTDAQKSLTELSSKRLENLSVERNWPAWSKDMKKFPA